MDFHVQRVRPFRGLGICPRRGGHWRLGHHFLRLCPCMLWGMIAISHPSHIGICVKVRWSHFRICGLDLWELMEIKCLGWARSAIWAYHYL